MNFIQQAYKGLNDFWRYLITSVIVLSPFLFNFVLYFFFPEIMEMAMEEGTGMSSNFELAANLFIFVILLVLLFVFVKFMHQRSITSLITSRKKTDWKRVFFSFILWTIISVSALIVSYLMEPEMFTWNFKPGPFFTLLIIALLLLPLQTSFEELMFRGYLMQGVGVWVKNRWFPLIFTSVLFGLMHSFNPEVEKLGPLVMIYYIGTGLVLGIMTLMDEGTELALGFHAANNIAAAIFVTQTWTVFQTEALFVDHSEPSLGFETFVPMFILFPLILFIFSKKYHWTNWKDRLFGKIEKPKSEFELFEEDSVLEID